MSQMLAANVAELLQHLTGDETRIVRAEHGWTVERHNGTKWLRYL